VRFAFRLLAAAIGLAILYAVVQLGIASGSNAKLVAWFGIASAIGAPVGLSLVGFAVAKSDRRLIERLAKVPEVERLITEAKTQEERVRILQEEQARLEEIIRLEARRQAARSRKQSLERDAQAILKELKLLDSELESLNEQVGHSIAADELEELRRRVRASDRGDVIIRLAGQTLRFDRDIVRALPFGLGNITLGYLRLIERTQKDRDNTNADRGETAA
jgi:hypothetical protein